MTHEMGNIKPDFSMSHACLLTKDNLVRYCGPLLIISIYKYIISVYIIGNNQIIVNLKYFVCTLKVNLLTKIVLESRDFVKKKTIKIINLMFIFLFCLQNILNRRTYLKEEKHKILKVHFLTSLLFI